MASFGRQKTRNKVCELGESLDEVRGHLLEADEAPGEAASSARIGSHVEEYEAGLSLSREVVKHST